MIEIRPMCEADLDEVLDIEQACFSEPWSRASMVSELTELADVSHNFVAVEDGEVLGYCGYRQVFDEAHIMNLAVREDRRRRGVAQAILNAMEADYPTRGIVYVTLEVRCSNEAARKLYEKNGFYEAGVRKAFYSKPREDALIMWKSCEEAEEKP